MSILSLPLPYLHHGLIPQKDFCFIGNIHDEVQAEVLEKYAELVGKTIAEAITKAGKHFNWRCPVTAGYDIGDSWKDTH